MKTLVISLMFILIPVLGFAKTISEPLFANVTGTETGTSGYTAPREVKNESAVNVHAKMVNYSGSVAVQGSIDGGTTYFTYTTFPAGNTNHIFRFPINAVLTHIRAVATDTYTTDTSRGNVSAYYSFRECCH